LCIGWIPDFGYPGDRITAPQWAPIVQQWQRTCQRETAIRYLDEYRDAHMLVIPCDRLR
jgi:hypothetical protein